MSAMTVRLLCRTSMVSPSRTETTGPPHSPASALANHTKRTVLYNKRPSLVTPSSNGITASRRSYFIYTFFDGKRIQIGNSVCGNLEEESHLRRPSLGFVSVRGELSICRTMGY